MGYESQVCFIIKKNKKEFAKEINKINTNRQFANQFNSKTKFYHPQLFQNDFIYNSSYFFDSLYIKPTLNDFLLLFSEDNVKWNSKEDFFDKIKTHSEFILKRQGEDSDDYESSFNYEDADLHFMIDVQDEYCDDNDNNEEYFEDGYNKKQICISDIHTNIKLSDFVNSEEWTNIKKDIIFQEKTPLRQLLVALEFGEINLIQQIFNDNIELFKQPNFVRTINNNIIKAFNNKHSYNQKIIPAYQIVEKMDELYSKHNIKQNLFNNILECTFVDKKSNHTKPELMSFFHMNKLEESSEPEVFKMSELLQKFIKSSINKKDSKNSFYYYFFFNLKENYTKEIENNYTLFFRDDSEPSSTFSLFLEKMFNNFWDYRIPINSVIEYLEPLQKIEEKTAIIAKNTFAKLAQQKLETNNLWQNKEYEALNIELEKMCLNILKNTQTYKKMKM